MSASAGEKKRQELLERKRQEMLAEYATQRAALAAAGEKDHTSSDRFVKVTEGMEEKLKKSTVGLVNAEDFKRLKEELLEENRRKAAQTDDIEKDEKKRKKKKDKKIKTLSFAGENEDGEEELERGDTDTDGRVLFMAWLQTLLKVCANNRPSS